jgi:Holliday junction resolvasome RuvABC endonuclease subunit
MSKEMYVYALDLSMSCTGVVIFDTKATPIFIGNVQNKTTDSNGVRLKKIADYLLDLREEYPPLIVIIERGFSMHNNATQSLFRVHGIANYIFHDKEQIYYPPKSVKAAILNGNATKKQVQDAIKLKYPDVKFSDIKIKKTKGKEESKDESDAFAVGLTFFIDKGLITWDKPEIKPKKVTKKKKEVKVD